VVVSSATSPIH